MELFLLAQSAPDAIPSPDNLGDFARALLAAVMGGQWAVLVGLILVTVVWAARKFLAPRAPFFATDEGAFSLNLTTSFLLALATAVTAGGFAAVTWPLVLKALEVSFLAAGGFAAIKKFAVPLLLRIPLFASLFPPKGDGPALVVDAQKIGLAAAVVAKAPTPEDVANGR